MKQNTILLLFITILSPVLAWTQPNARTERNIRTTDTRHCQSYFNKVHLNSGNKEDVTAFLNQRIKRERKKVQLDFESHVESPAGNHYTFIQKVNGIPVYRSETKVNTDKQGNVTSVFDNSFNVSQTSAIFNFPDNLRLARYVENNFAKEVEYTIKKMLYYNNDTLVPVLQAVVIELKTFRSVEILIDAAGSLVYEQDLNLHFKLSNSDTTSYAKVFLPDPLTTAHVSYGAPYKDYNDSSFAELNAQRKTVSIRTTFLGDGFHLENPFVKIDDFSEPIVPVAISATPNFYYNRDHPGFEDVNAFYHITAMHDHVKALGYNLANYQIQVDTHANGGDDNSTFIYTTSPPRLLFGEGGVDDAEDADVIIHEYSHALSFSASPGSNSGSERQCIDEAYCDYFAASYSRSLDSYLWQNMFSWDGHNEYWKGRVVKSTKKYSQAEFSNIYNDTDVWSSTLMQLWEDLGRTVTDKIAIQSLYGLAKNMEMPAAAKLVIQADSLLYNGSHYQAILKRFVERGILTDPTGIDALNNGPAKIIIKNTFAFAENKGALSIDFPEVCSGSLVLYSTSGRKILEESFLGVTQVAFEKTLPAGIYFLQVNTPGAGRTFKIMKF